MGGAVCTAFLLLTYLRRALLHLPGCASMTTPHSLHSWQHWGLTWFELKLVKKLRQALGERRCNGQVHAGAAHAGVKLS